MEMPSSRGTECWFIFLVPVWRKGRHHETAGWNSTLEADRGGTEATFA